MASAMDLNDHANQRAFFAMGSKFELFSDRGEYFFYEASKSLHAFEKNISTWKKTSSLSVFNQSQEWVQFDSLSFNALKNSLACSMLTKGYFHPGMGQLIEQWGLRDKLKFPFEKDRELALRNSDLTTLLFDDEKLKIKKGNKSFWFEEGGFAKGAAMDAIVDLANKVQSEDLFMNFSGQIYSKKKREIGIADPENRNSAAVLVSIEKESLSTSGIGVQHFSFGNKKFGHILNPITGFPLAHTLKSMTVIHPLNIWADCLSTGLLVMSENINELREWIVGHPDTKVILLEKTAGGLIVETSCGLKNKIRINQKVSQLNENC